MNYIGLNLERIRATLGPRQGHAPQGHAGPRFYGLGPRGATLLWARATLGPRWATRLSCLGRRWGHAGATLGPH